MPVLILITGRGPVIAVVTGAIVVLFPALVKIAFGLHGAPQMSDVIAVYGGSSCESARWPCRALPSFFAAIRISIPGAITGALLAEWLATGDGIGGGAIAGWTAQARFDDIVEAWVVLVTGGLADPLHGRPDRGGRRAGAHGHASAEEHLGGSVDDAECEPGFTDRIASDGRR